MKRLPLLFFIIFFSLVSHAQYNMSNSQSRDALVLYERDLQGFYQRQINVSVDNVDNVLSRYAYDKKNKKLYVTNAYGNYVITVSGDVDKEIKKNKSIPQLKPEEIQELVASENNALDAKYAKLNKAREKQIIDSIARVRENERKAAMEKARQDSIKQVQADALKRYKTEHKWQVFPVGTSRNSYSNSISLRCALCDNTKTYYSSDSVVVVNISNDTIYTFETKEGMLDYKYLVLHAYAIPSEWKEREQFKYHMAAFSDSIARQETWNTDLARGYNAYSFKEYVDKLTKEAPHGFFVDWGWDAEYSMVTFEFEFLNLDKRTIKYIDVYWNVYNDVDDLRGSGHFKGTGPLEQYQNASWSWDSSSYFVAGDSSWMKFTKVIITYMNGQKLTLTGNNIIY